MFRPFALLSAAALCSFGAALRAADDQPKDVIARAIKAHGGEETLTKNKAGMSRGKGKITIPNLGEVEFTQETAHMLPDRFKESLEMTVAGMTIKVLTLAVGEKISIEANGKQIELQEKQKDAFKDAGHKIKVARLVPLLKEKEYELSPIGEEKVEGKPAVGVRVVSKGHGDLSLFFDKETNLLVKVEGRTAEPINGNEVKEERIIAEYQKNKDGLQVPKKVIIKHDGTTFLEIELSDVELLEKLDDSEFKNPNSDK
jgi:hypothetical protein